MKNVYSDNVMRKNRIHKSKIILKFKFDVKTIHAVILKKFREKIKYLVKCSLYLRDQRKCNLELYVKHNFHIIFTTPIFKLY